ncbi:hypothetical protein [Rufibacter ruber]|uniref:exodeoxyribonuclease X C-terminal domain-containing protein n=1 Tax=Rufibacter ruber TaxID=1783499 RepID=UPI00082CB229|nr:hypothetical protein [Rufibacter ruber]
MESNAIETQETTECPDHHKDFCWCFKNATANWRKERRDRSVAAITKMLDTHKVNYEESNVPNVVLVKADGLPDIFLSLVKEDSSAPYKIREVGTNDWTTIKRPDFIHLYGGRKKKAKAPEKVRIGFGKYAGKNVGEVLEENPLYLLWALRSGYCTLPLTEAINAALSKPENAAKVEAAAAEEDAAEVHLMPFGKYRGQPLKDVFVKDPGYFEWLMTKEITRPLRRSIENYLPASE